MSALIQHNHDQADYGVPPLNGFPADVPRNTALRLTPRPHDPGRADVLGAAIEHKFSEDLELRNQTQFNHVSTEARETAPQGIGTVGRLVCSHRVVRSAILYGLAAEQSLRAPAEP